MPAKTPLRSPIRSLKTMFGTMSKKRRATILATVAVLAVGGIVAGGLSVQSAAVAAEAAEVAAAKQARVEAAAKQAAYEERVEAEALTTIEAATPIIAAAEGKVDAAALATPVASLVERATLEVEIVEDLIEQAAAAIPVVQAAIDEADRLAAEAAAAAAAEAERVAAEAAAIAEAARAAAATPDGAKAVARDMASSKYGWGADQFSCLVNLWQKESGWNVNAYNASSGATGIPQSLPGSKMATHGADWKTNAATQISWGLDYIKRAYGTPCGAWGHSQSVNWY